MRMVVRWALSILSLLAYGNANAYCYTAWQGQLSFTQSGTSNGVASEVCKKLIDAAGPNRSGQYGALGDSSSSGGLCFFYRNGTSYEALGEWKRAGTAASVCEPVLPPDPPDPPEPEPDACAATAGNPDLSVSYAGPRSAFPAGTPAQPANSRMCSGGCAYSYSGGSTTKCGSLVGGDQSQLYCVFGYTGTGVKCVPSDEPKNGSAPPDPNPPPDPNDPTNPANNCGPGYAWSGSTCVKYFNQDPTPGDGGTGTPGDGGDGDDGGGGTGGGPGTGGGGTGGGGDDDGGGTGGGGGGGGGSDGDGGTASYSSDCKVEPACNGDPFQCSILRQSWSNRCAMLADPTTKDLEKMEDIKQAGISDREAIQGEFNSEVAGLMGDFNSTVASRSRQGSCPSDPEFQVLGKSFALPISKVCPHIGFLRYLVIAIGYIVAARIISRVI